MPATFDAPGPGHWELDRSHFPGGTTPIAQWLMRETMPAGMERVFAEQGVPAKRLDAAFVNGYMYTRLVPLIGGDKPPKRLPPAWLLRIATRVHPEFRKRTRTATKTLAGRPWNDIVVRWDREMRPDLSQRNRAFQAEDPTQVDDVQLADHLRRLLAHLRETTELHFWLHGHDLGPIARYLHACTTWGLEPTDALDALTGASPSTARPLEQLAALRAEIEAHDVDPAGLASLDQVRAVSDGAAAKLDEYLAERGDMLVTGYDFTALTLRELPGLVLAGLREAAPPPATDHHALAALLRANVPVAEQGRFDMLLSDARGVMDMRDDNGPVTVELPCGLMRRALLEAGRRLAASGRLQEAEHALLLAPEEARDPFADRPQLAERVSGRAAERLAMDAVTPPGGLGPVEPMPPIDVLPAPLAEMVSSVQTDRKSVV